MRIEATGTTMSWIPSESVWSTVRIGFDLGVTHWDDPPPDTVAGPDEVRAMSRADRFRFANVLGAWADVEDGRVVAAGVHEDSGLVMGSTTVRVARVGATFRAVSLPTLRPEPQHGGGEVTFLQTVGGRTALPLPRRVSRPPYVQWTAPTVWTTLALTIRADGSSDVRLAGASTFPRHWVYGADGRLSHKSGLTDENTWLTEAFGTRTPWGDHDTPALVVAVESDLERQMSTDIMHGGHVPEVRRIRAGDTVTVRASPGTSCSWSSTGSSPSTSTARCSARSARERSWASGRCSRAAAHLHAHRRHRRPGGGRPRVGRGPRPAPRALAGSPPRGRLTYFFLRLAARARARSRFSSASSTAASSMVGALPPYDAGSHQEPGGCSSAG